MRDRDRLIELHEEAGKAWNCHIDKCLYNDDLPNKTYDEYIADHLLANGIIVPPVSLNQRVYRPIEWRNCIDECKVSSLTLKADGSLKIRLTSGIYKSVFEITVDEIGKTVFLSREKAERVLEVANDEQE